MEPGDAERVTRLYLRTFWRAEATPPALVRFVRDFYCAGPFHDADIPSLVYTGADGRVVGFIGVNVVPMLVNGRRVRAACCGSLMVESRNTSPLAGASLVKAFLTGPQDLSISETANPVSQNMFERLKVRVMAAHSLDWVRVLRPATFSVATAARRKPLLAHALPLARLADRALNRGAARSSLLGLTPDASPAGLLVEAVDQTGFAALLDTFSQSYRLRPDWSGGYGAHVLAQAVDKPDYGPAVLAAVTLRGAPIGAFLAHERPGGVRRVLQVLAAPERMTDVLQALFADARAKGLSGVRGRSEPAILQSAPGRHMAFATVATTMVQSRDEELQAAFAEGNVLLNGLAGESWCRLFGGALF